MTAAHKMERALVSRTIDGVIHYVNKDRQANLLHLIDVVEKIAGEHVFRKKL